MDYIIIFVIIMINENKKKEGFEGQKAIVIPRKILTSRCEKNPIIDSLYITDIGYYPKARFHYRRRPDGAVQNILIYCEGGEGMVSIMSKEYHIFPGEFIIIPRKISHLYSADAQNPWTIYWVHFAGSTSDSIVSYLCKKLNGNKGYLKYPANSITIFNEIYNNLEKGYGNDNLVFSNLFFTQFITTFLFNEKYRNPVEAEIKSTVDESIVFFRRNLDKMLTLNEIAASVGLSVSHFSTVFKKKTGFPPLEYFNQLKIQQACQYLLFTELKIKDIGAMLGMNDPYYFSRAFSRIMGVSPKYYRESRSGQP